MEIIEFIAATVAFLALNSLIYYIIEVNEKTFAPFNYKPWSCRTCLTFWSGIWCSAAAALAGAWIFAWTIAIISALDAVAKKIDENDRYGNSDD